MVLEAYTLDFAFVADTAGTVSVAAGVHGAGRPSHSQPVAAQSGSLSGEYCNWIVMTCDLAELATGQLAKQVMLHQEYHLQPRRRGRFYPFLG